MPTQVLAADEDEAVTNPPPTGELDESRCTMRVIPSPQANGESRQEDEGAEPKEQHKVSEETGDSAEKPGEEKLKESGTEK